MTVLIEFNYAIIFIYYSSKYLIYFIYISLHIVTLHDNNITTTTILTNNQIIFELLFVLI